MNFAALALVTSIALQAPTTSSAKDLLNQQRSLTAAEIETVVSGIRGALAGRTLRFMRDRGGNPEILLGPDGMPRRVRIDRDGPPGERITTVTVDGGTGPVRVTRGPEPFVYLTEYTAVPARRCNGALATGDMVVESAV